MTDEQLEELARNRELEKLGALILNKWRDHYAPSAFWREGAMKFYPLDLAKFLLWITPDIIDDACKAVKEPSQ